MMESEYAIVGGGVVGMAVAYGLQQMGKQVIVLDEGDIALRPSRGNFGLVWVQSKGLNAPHYAAWSQQSAALWGKFAQELQDLTGVDLHLQQRGGFDFHLSETSLAERVEQYTRLKQSLGGRDTDYPFEVLDNAALQAEEPAIGKQVVGAILHHQDGHVNPLRLLNALYRAFQLGGGQLVNGSKITNIEATSSAYHLVTLAGQRIRAQKVVICAGLGANTFAKMLGFPLVVQPQRGQILITEKLPRFIQRPSGIIRQVDEGGVQIGDSKENVGYDDSETLAVSARIAQRAIMVYPQLAQAKMVRSWGALRVMTPDGLPVYTQSKTHQGCYLLTCHSGITLAAAHSVLLPRWLEATTDAPNLEKFHEQRFSVPAPAL